MVLPKENKRNLIMVAPSAQETLTTNDSQYAIVSLDRIQFIQGDNFYIEDNCVVTKKK